MGRASVLIASFCISFFFIGVIGSPLTHRMIKDVGTDLERLMLDTNAIYQYDFSKDKELSEVNKDLEEIIDIAMKMSTTQRLLLFQSMNALTAVERANSAKSTMKM